MADGKRDFHRLVVVFVLGADVVTMIGRVDHQAELPFALLLMTVDADVDGVATALFANQRRGVDVGAGISFVERQDRQEVEVRIVALQDHFFAGRVLRRNLFHRNRVMLAGRQVLDHLRYRG